MPLLSQQHHHAAKLLPFDKPACPTKSVCQSCWFVDHVEVGHWIQSPRLQATSDMETSETILPARSDKAMASVPSRAFALTTGGLERTNSQCKAGGQIDVQGAGSVTTGV